MLVPLNDVEPENETVADVLDVVDRVKLGELDGDVLMEKVPE